MAELVASQLRGQIVRGELRPGDALPSESELMEVFEVSRPTLREAFRVLEAESLIQVRRGSRGGAQVQAPDIGVAAKYVGLLLQMEETPFEDIFQAWMVIEPSAIRSLAKNNASATVDELRAAVAAAEEAVDDPPALAHASAEFHQTLMRLAENTTLSILAGLLNTITERYFLAVSRTIIDDATESIRQRKATVKTFQKLVDLIEAGDAAAAEAFWLRHMEAALKINMAAVGATTVVDVLD